MMDLSDTEVSPSEHSKLLTAISQLDSKQRIKPPSRKEPSLQVSEFHLVQSGEGQGNAVQLFDLTKALKTRSNHVQISRKLNAIRRKGRTLPKPLEKPVAERIQRAVGFKKIRKQVSRWEPIVQKNRTDPVSFPLQQEPVKMDTSREFFTRFKTQSPLEAQFAEILGQSKCAQDDKEKAEKEFPLSLEELAERRKEMARLRNQQSYEAAKARRQGKIKSKKYHRVLRREKLRKQLKDFETLQKTDPEAALEQLQLLERVRAKERMTLRHRNTGQWARSRAVRAKYDPQSRQALAEQLTISRDLTKKLQTQVDSSEEEEDAEQESGTNNPSTVNQTKNDNPWITADPELQTFISGFRQYREKQKKIEPSKDLEKGVTTQSKFPSITDKSPLSKNNSSPEKILDDELSSNQESCGSEDDGVECNEINYSNGNSSKDLDNSATSTLSQEKCAKSKFSSPEKQNSLVKVCSKEKNVNRKIKEPSPPTISSEKAIMERSSEVPRKMATNKTVIKGTSSWVVTPIKNTKVQGKKTEAMNNSKKTPKLKSVSKENGRNSTPVKSVADSGEDRTNKSVHIDDLFEDMQQKLKQKVSKKISELERNLLGHNNLERSQSKQTNDVEIDVTSQDFKIKARRPQEDLQLVEETGRSNQSNTQRSSLPVVPKVSLVEKEATKKQTDDVDPNRFLSVKQKVLQTLLPDVVMGGDEGLDNEEEEESQQMTITEAFTGDDVIAEFAQEKADEEEKSKPKDIDLSLPGWGSWGGKDLVVSKRKKRRLIVKFPKVAPRKDENKGHLIINEDKDTKILEHQVTDLPFPFTTVKDFEASIRAPIGNTWIPETAHRKLIEPQVKTKLGTVIKPMDEEVLVNKMKAVKGL